MALQIIGAGFGRTGTVSMKAALERLGFGPCYHMREILQPRPGMNDGHLEAWSEHARARRDGRAHTMDWSFIFRHYASCMDHPTCLYYEELMALYPDAKVILNVRDSERWFRSWKELFEGIGFLRKIQRFVPRIRRALDVVDGLIRDGEMGGSIEAASNIEIFERHNREVIERVPADRLLVFDVRDGWAPLCEFLDVDVPDEPFPHLNESKGSMQARLIQYWLETTSPRTRLRWAFGGATALALTLFLAL